MCQDDSIDLRHVVFPETKASRFLSSVAYIQAVSTLITTWYFVVSDAISGTFSNRNQ